MGAHYLVSQRGGGNALLHRRLILALSCCVDSCSSARKASSWGSSSRDVGMAAIADSLPCNIDRWRACPAKGRKNKRSGKGKCLTEADFESLYLAKQPVIIDGLADDWPALKHWSSLDDFVVRHKDTVHVGLKDAGDLALGARPSS